MAGRDAKRLEKLVAGLEGGSPAPGVLVADVAKPDSLAAMAQASRVLINGVGPFRFGVGFGAVPQGAGRVSRKGQRCWGHSQLVPCTAPSLLHCLATLIAVWCRFYGEPVFKACVEAGTDYLDICGEPGALRTLR